MGETETEMSRNDKKEKRKRKRNTICTFEIKRSHRLSISRQVRIKESPQSVLNTWH